MNLSDLSTAEEMIEDIKMRFEMSRTFFDIEIDWRDFLVYLYYERYHSDDAEYLRGDNANLSYIPKYGIWNIKSPVKVTAWMPLPEIYENKDWSN